MNISEMFQPSPNQGSCIRKTRCFSGVASLTLTRAVGSTSNGAPGPLICIITNEENACALSCACRRQGQPQEEANHGKHNGPQDEGRQHLNQGLRTSGVVDGKRNQYQNQTCQHPDKECRRDLTPQDAPYWNR